MTGFLSRVAGELLDRLGGPLHFRVAVMPAIAALLGVRAGLRDAREGRPPFLWALCTGSGGRSPALRSAWKDIGRVIVLALAMDALYQYCFLKHFRPVEALIVTFVCAVLPYALVRAITTPIARRSSGTGAGR